MGTWTNVYHSILIIHKYQHLQAKPQRWWTLIAVLLTERHTNPHPDASFALLKLYIQFTHKCHKTAQLIFTPHRRSVFFFFANYIPEIAWFCDFTGQVTNVEGFYTSFHFNKPAEVRKNNIRWCSLRFDTPERHIRISDVIDSYNFSSFLFTLQKLHCCTHTHTHPHTNTHQVACASFTGRAVFHLVYAEHSHTRFTLTVSPRGTAAARREREREIERDLVLT